MTALVTGADGFVGRALCARMEAIGERVRPATRETVGDLERISNWSPILDGVDVVYHVAGRAHVTNERDDAEAAYRRTNVDATIALATAAARAGVRHFVYVSSVKAAGERSGQHPLRESDPPTPEDAYGRSKRAAEQALETIRNEAPMLVTIVRPPLVFGPGVRANFLSLLRAVDRGTPLPLALVQNHRSFIYVGNLADALIASVRAGRAASSTFFVSDGEDLATPDLVRRLARALGRPARLWPLPPSLLRLGLSLLGRRAAADRLLGNLQVDSSAFRNAASWSPPFSVDDGIAATAAWYRNPR